MGFGMVFLGTLLGAGPDQISSTLHQNRPLCHILSSLRVDMSPWG